MISNSKDRNIPKKILKLSNRLAPRKKPLLKELLIKEVFGLNLMMCIVNDQWVCLKYVTIDEESTLVTGFM